MSEYEIEDYGGVEVNKYDCICLLKSDVKFMKKIVADFSNWKCFENLTEKQIMDIKEMIIDRLIYVVIDTIDAIECNALTEHYKESDKNG